MSQDPAVALAAAAQAIAAEQARAAWSAAYAAWASVFANIAVVCTALGVPGVLWWLDQKRLRRANAAAVRTGLIVLGEIGEAEDWIRRALNSHTRTVQSAQLTMRRRIAGVRHSVEVVLARGVESAEVTAFLAEAFVLVKDAEQVFDHLPIPDIPDGVGVEVLTPSRVADLRRAERSISEMLLHRHNMTQQGEMLQVEFEERRPLRRG